MLAEWRGSALVKKNPHSNGFQRVGSVLKHSACLLKRNAGKPLNKLRELRSILKIFEQCGNRDASPTKKPSATYALRITLYGWARGPINHALIVDLV